MIKHKYIVTLTNGTTQQQYEISAISQQQAIILAQAEAINLVRGYEFVSIVEEDISKVFYCHANNFAMRYL